MLHRLIFSPFFPFGACLLFVRFVGYFIDIQWSVDESWWLMNWWFIIKSLCLTVYLLSSNVIEVREQDDNPTFCLWVKMRRRRFGRWGSRIYIERTNDGALVLSHFPRCGRLQWWDCSPRLTCFFKISPKYFKKSLWKHIFEKSRIISKSLLFLLETKLAIIKLFSDNNFLQAITEQLKLVFRDDSKLIFKNWKLWTYLWYPISTFWIVLSPVHFICWSCDKEAVSSALASRETSTYWFQFPFQFRKNAAHRCKVILTPSCGKMFPFCHIAWALSEKTRITSC